MLCPLFFCRNTFFRSKLNHVKGKSLFDWCFGCKLELESLPSLALSWAFSHVHSAVALENKDSAPGPMDDSCSSQRETRDDSTTGSTSAAELGESQAHKVTASCCLVDELLRVGWRRVLASAGGARGCAFRSNVSRAFLPSSSAACHRRALHTNHTAADSSSFPLVLIGRHSRSSARRRARRS